MKTYVHLRQYLAEFFERETFQTKVLDKIKTQILCSKTFSENLAVYEIKWKKYGTAEHATDGNRVRCLRYAC